MINQRNQKPLDENSQETLQSILCLDLNPDFAHSSVHADEPLTWKMFTQIGHIVRKWDPNFKAMHPSLYQPKFTSRSLQTSQHTHTQKVHLCKSHSALQLNHSFQPFTNTFQTSFSCPKPPQTLNSQTNGALFESWRSMRRGGMPPPPLVLSATTGTCLGSHVFSDPGVAECPGSNFNRHKSILLPGINISCSNPFPGWDINNCGCFYTDRLAHTQILERVLTNLLSTPLSSWFNFTA